MDRKIPSGTLTLALGFRTPLRSRNFRMAGTGIAAIFAPKSLRCLRVAETGFISMEMERSEKRRFLVPPGRAFLLSISGARVETTNFGFLNVVAIFFLGRIFAPGITEFRFPFMFTVPPPIAGVDGRGIMAGDSDEDDV